MYFREIRQMNYFQDFLYAYFYKFFCNFFLIFLYKNPYKSSHITKKCGKIYLVIGFLKKVYF